MGLVRGTVEGRWLAIMSLDMLGHGLAFSVLLLLWRPTRHAPGVGSDCVL